MNKFNRKSLYLALAAGFAAAGAAGTASAVNVNSRNTGQVLIYPYYTVRGGTDTLVSVVNTTNSAKAVKVRFTEGKNSREVLDFNLYMSPRDVWTGAVVNTTNGAKLITGDKSCTYPVIPAAGQDFVNYAYSGAVVTGIVSSGGDGETASLDRTREGYFEIIEMGVITNATIAAAVTHTSAGVPANCPLVQTASMIMDISGGANAVSAPSGGLAGTASLINVAGGTDYSYNPVALAAFSLSNNWYPAGDIRPDMRNASPATSRVFKGGTVVTTDWTGSFNLALTGTPAVNAVSAVLMHDNIINEYVLDTATASATDWVITMPTKRYYVPVAATSSAGSYSPFTMSFANGGACEPVTVSYWDREEQSPSTPVGFSPPQPGAVGTCLPWEATVVSFNATVTGVSNLLGSTNTANIATSYQNGWANLNFAQTYSSLAAAGNSPAGGAHTYVGLPTVGFMLQNFKNGNVGGVLSNYGGNFDHKYTTNIVVPGGVPAATAE